MNSHDKKNCWVNSLKPISQGVRFGLKHQKFISLYPLTLDINGLINLTT